MLCDSLIFDMDGTLWDAVDSYIKIWNDTFEQLGIDAERVDRKRLMGTMGQTLEQILTQLVPNLTDKETFLKVLDANETAMMPVLGGKLYPGVLDTLRQLGQKIPLFLVSNCGSYGLKNFLHFTGMENIFRDTRSHGENGLSKAMNIKQIVDLYSLQHAVYVGDTQTDCNSAHQAGIPMIWAAYGFGNVTDPDAVIHSFPQLLQTIQTAQ